MLTDRRCYRADHGCSRRAGETQTEMLHALHLEASSLEQTNRSFASLLNQLKGRDGSDCLALTVADHVCLQKGLSLRPEYESLAGETSVTMMRQCSQFRYAQAQRVKLVELRHKGRLSMIVVLPDGIDGLEEWIRGN